MNKVVPILNTEDQQNFQNIAKYLPIPVEISYYISKCFFYDWKTEMDAMFYKRYQLKEERNFYDQLIHSNGVGLISNRQTIPFIAFLYAFFGHKVLLIFDSREKMRQQQEHIIFFEESNNLLIRTFNREEVEYENGGSVRYAALTYLFLDDLKSIHNVHFYIFNNSIKMFISSYFLIRATLVLLQL